MKTTSALLLSALLASSISGCATRYVEVSPTCEPPPRPALPTLSKGELWDHFIDSYKQRGYSQSQAVQLGDAEFRRLERYITRLNGYANEQRAMLGPLCGQTDQ